MLYEYSGIKMKMVKTNEIRFDAVFTDDGTTYLYTHYLIDIQAVVNPSTMAYKNDPEDSPTEVMGTFPATTIQSIRHMLMQPRRQLSVYDEKGNFLLTTPDKGFASDAKSGPLPKSCGLVNISGARTILIRWICEGWINECPYVGGDNVPYILSNRWTDQMEINEYQLTTRTYVGHTVFNKGLLDRDKLTPDAFRNQVFPPVSYRFQRKRVEITQNKEGSELAWRVTDIEGMYVLGDTGFAGQGAKSGILEINGAQRIVPFKPGGENAALVGNTINHIELIAKGSYYANQWVMIQRLLELINSLTPPLMTASDKDPTKCYYIVNGSIERSLGQYEKTVKLSISIMCPAPPVTSQFTGSVNCEPISADVWFVMNSMVDQSTGLTPVLKDNGSRGSHTALLLTQVLTSSCAGQPEMPTVDVNYNAGPGGINATQDPGTPSPGSTTTETSSTKYNTGNPYPYTVYTIECEQRNITNIKQIPICGPKPTGPPQGNTGYNRPITGDPQAPAQQGGTTSSTATCALVQVALPMTKYYYKGVAERMGYFPTLPNPQPSNKDEYVLLSWHISPFYAVPGYDGITPVYRCDFEYVYAKKAAIDPNNPTIPLGKYPFSLFPPEVRTKDDFFPASTDGNGFGI